MQLEGVDPVLTKHIKMNHSNQIKLDENDDDTWVNWNIKFQSAYLIDDDEFEWGFFFVRVCEIIWIELQGTFSRNESNQLIDGKFWFKFFPLISRYESYFNICYFPFPFLSNINISYSSFSDNSSRSLYISKYFLKYYKFS